MDKIVTPKKTFEIVYFGCQTYIVFFILIKKILMYLAYIR